MFFAGFLVGGVFGVVFVVLWAVASNPQVLMGDMSGGCKRCRHD